jgi:hypothetical protein
VQHQTGNRLLVPDRLHRTSPMNDGWLARGGGVGAGGRGART